MGRYTRGFSLIELLMVTTAIAILAGLAFPAYMDYTQRARRSDAMTALLRVQQAEEKWRANNPQYSADLTELGFTANGSGDFASPDGYYLLNVDAADAGSYRATATPDASGPQAGDSDCGTFAVNQDGAIIDDGSYAGASCWKKH